MTTVSKAEVVRQMLRECTADNTHQSEEDDTLSIVSESDTDVEDLDEEEGESDDFVFIPGLVVYF